MSEDLTKLSKKANKAWKKYSYGTRPSLHRGGPVNYESALDKAMKGSPKSRTYTNRWGTEKKVSRPPFGVKKRVKGGKN